MSPANIDPIAEAEKAADGGKTRRGERQETEMAAVEQAVQELAAAYTPEGEKGSRQYGSQREGLAGRDRG